MKRFVYLLIIGLIFVLLYNVFPSKEGYNGDDGNNPNNENQGPPTEFLFSSHETAAQVAAAQAAAAQAAAAQAAAAQAAAAQATAAQAAAAQSASAHAEGVQATADQSMAKAMQGIADDTLEGRGDYTHPLVVDIFAAAARCPGPVICGGVTCGVPNCKCVGIPPNDTCGPVEGCPPCCPPCQAGAPCPKPVPCGDTYCTQPNCLCYGDPPTCHPGGCTGCGPTSPSPASQYIKGLVDKEKAYEEQCLSNRAQIAANAATLTSFPAKLKSAYSQLKPMELKINKNTQYIQDSAGILGKFIRNQMAAAAAAAAKADGINIDGVSFGIIPQGAIPKLLWFVGEGMPEAEVLLKKLAAGAKAAAAKAK